MTAPSITADRRLETAVERHITRVYAEQQRVVNATARALGISRPTLLKKLRQYGLKPQPASTAPTR